MTDKVRVFLSQDNSDTYFKGLYLGFSYLGVGYWLLRFRGNKAVVSGYWRANFEVEVR